MRIETSFAVPGQVATVWPVLADPLMVELLPGALIDRRNGDLVEGRFQVTMGTLAMSYSGQVKQVTRNDRAYQLVLAARGEDDKGRGRISADIVLQAKEETSSETRWAVHVDLDVTGAPATMGGRAVESVIRRLTDDFAFAVRRRPQSSLAVSRHGAGSAREIDTTTRWRRSRFNASTMVRSIAALLVGGCIAGTLVRAVVRGMSRRQR